MTASARSAPSLKSDMSAPMIVIHGSYRSRATRNVWLLEEIGVPWRLERIIQHYRPEAVEGARGIVHTRSPEFLKRFPAGTMPVMQDGAFCLSESLAINLYLARTYGGDMSPRSLEDEAIWIQWALFGATAIEPAALALSTLLQSNDTGDDDIIINERALHRPFGVLESTLEDQEWLTGKSFSVADINIAEIVRFAASRETLFERFPALKGWLVRCHTRPAFQRMWALRNSEQV